LEIKHEVGHDIPITRSLQTV